MTSTMNRDRKQHHSGVHNCQAVKKAYREIAREADIPRRILGMSKFRFLGWFKGAADALELTGETRQKVRNIIS